ncbi:MAG: phenylacetate-CoA oxygenase subunit PaaC [Alphaproteobacteria bacterium]|nr:phenylacetate-CoA oxygenase subunit PaaC [Alphaproteobacteria bacterium]
MTARFAYLLRLGDTALVLGHRLAEWCGSGPTPEEDIALANIGLDLTGQATAWLDLAGAAEGKGRDADALAYFRDGTDFRNLLLAEQPNEDFGHTMVRQMLFDAWHVELLGGLERSADAGIAAVAAKARREAEYHWRRSSDWVVRLGDGTEQSHARVAESLVRLWPFTGEMFARDAVVAELVTEGIAPEPAPLLQAWNRRVDAILTEATLTRPADGWMQSGGLEGRHGEALGHLLAEMQSLARQHPGAKW